MDDAARIYAVSATLLPNCSLQVELVLPGWDEPHLTVTEQHADFLTRVGSQPRPINLEGGDRTDELAREHIARHIRHLERRMESQRRLQRYEQQRRAPALAAYEPFAC
jgi:hypothetical protein